MSGVQLEIRFWDVMLHLLMNGTIELFP